MPDQSLIEKETPQIADPASEAPNSPDKGSFYVVTLGGSAGSLTALEKFFKNMPPDSGIAFIVITHLEQNKGTMLPQILQKWTAMQVEEVREGTEIRPNCVFVMPSSDDMTIKEGKLELIPRPDDSGRHLPIDQFLQDIAQEIKQHAIAVILSGMDGDGSIGVKMIMENFGLVVVQEPSTADFDSMPRSAIATDFVDYILPPEDMPEQILKFVANPMSKVMREDSEADDDKTLLKVLAIIREKTGHDFSQYKRNTVMRRIERRMQSHQLKNFSRYLQYISENSIEATFLFKELLIGVTKFFRDEEAFAVLKEKILTYLRSAKIENNVVRVWVAACSTGEEAYSIAILLDECIAEFPLNNFKIQIFATDINDTAIDFARAGTYPHNIEADVTPERLQKYFTKVGGDYTIIPGIRDTIVFATHNIIKDAPFTKLDLLTCRNFLIYLSGDLQRKLIPVFNYTLQKDGILFLGPSEALTGSSEYFIPLDIKWKVYRKSNSMGPMSRPIEFPFSVSPQSSPRITAIPEARFLNDAAIPASIQRVLLMEYVPPSVVINAKGEILYINGRTGKFLEPAPGASIMNVFMMAREGLKNELEMAVHRAFSENETIFVENINVKTNGHYQMINLRVKPLVELASLKGLYLVLFEETIAEKPRKGKKHQPEHSPDQDKEIKVLEKELQYTRLRLQATIEEMETSLEELKSTNEELQSANEELQSTNEEAMTNKEEMISLNEELTVINSQYQLKGAEHSQMNDDMRNLLDSTDIATIFLDNTMKIKSFTPPASNILNVIKTDIGRPITHIRSNLRYDKLEHDVRDVLDNLSKIEGQVQTDTGQWYQMRISPYRTLNNYILGAVATFTEITATKVAEEKLLKSNIILQQAQKLAHFGHFEFDMNTRELTGSDELYRIYGYEPKSIALDEKFFKSTTKPEDLERIQAIIEKAFMSCSSFSFEREVLCNHNIRRTFHTEARFIADDNGKALYCIGTEQDISERRENIGNQDCE